MMELMTIQQQIHELPGRPPFMFAKDLAAMYGTSPKRVAEQVRRNKRRFPHDFCFRLTPDEAAKCGVNQVKGGGGNAPLAFTHNGANALAGVLSTPEADERSVLIARAFTALEQGHRPQMPAPQRLLPCRGVLLPIVEHPDAGAVVLTGPLERALGRPRGSIRKAVERERSLSPHYVLLAGQTLDPCKGPGRLRSTVNITAALRLEGVKLFAMLGYAGGDSSDIVLAVHNAQQGQLAFM